MNPVADQDVSVWTITTGRFSGHGTDRHFVLPTVIGPALDAPTKVVPLERCEHTHAADLEYIQVLEESRDKHMAARERLHAECGRLRHLLEEAYTLVPDLKTRIGAALDDESAS